MTNNPFLTKELFLSCNWIYEPDSENHYGYPSVMRSLQTAAKEKADEGEIGQSEILDLFSRVASMMLEPSSVNEPFKPIYQDFQADRRSSVPDDFTLEELSFFAEVLNDINDPWLKARLADMLWLCLKPKNIDHAKLAIAIYSSHKINVDSWHKGVGNCWHRAARLSRQINDTKIVKAIQQQLFSAFVQDYPDSLLMNLWLAIMLDELNMDTEFAADIAIRLRSHGEMLAGSGDLINSRSYLELAAKKYRQTEDQENWLDCLLLSAELYEKEADARFPVSQMVANTFYENAIQAYRRIPVKHRLDRDVESKIRSIRAKISETGQAALGEMQTFRSPSIDLSETAEASMEHVSDRGSVERALKCFAGLYPGPSFSELKDSAQSSMKENPLSTLVGAKYFAADGRVVAKTSGMILSAGEDDPDNQAVLASQIHQQFSFEMELVVKGQVLPALRQLLSEYRFTRGLLESLCYHSPFVPVNREKQAAYALWLGFEHDFANALHLLSPQFEHCIRIKLKDAEAQTSNVDQNGIESENGLSTLMDLPEASTVFSADLIFEVKSIFTESMGSNLRNEVAHGLLDDDSAASTASIYAWWMILRLIIQSFALEDENPGKLGQ